MAHFISSLPYEFKWLIGNYDVGGQPPYAMPGPSWPAWLNLLPPLAPSVVCALCMVRFCPKVCAVHVSVHVLWECLQWEPIHYGTCMSL